APEDSIVNSALLLMWLLRESVSPTTRRRRGRHFWPPRVGLTDTFAEFRATSTTSPPADERPLGIRVLCFGGFDVERNGLAVRDWRRNKARNLLKILIDRRHPVPRDVMVELLWPDVEARAAGNNLRVTLHALRQALAGDSDLGSKSPDCVLLEGGNLILNPQVPLWIDVDEFTSRFLYGCKLEREGRDLEAIGAFEHAEELYRDDYLIEDLYEDWTQARREELKDQYLLIVTKLADHCLERRDFVGCILRCHKILQRDACREDAYQRLMYAYALLGQPSQALHWYDVCERTLSRELDLGPSEYTIQLHQQILAREISRPAAPDGSSRPAFPVRSGSR
ncbi:MAG TPA: BTAD domain-containing putative transcriptional regulator, partial [Chloroflexota bacterium]|nr:BTAD domain-containing putative transcriptional regulator [Chloroflexota bacterium]